MLNSHAAAVTVPTHSCPVDHDTLKSTPSLWDEHIVNRRSQAMMIPGTDIGECRHCKSSLTLIVDRAAYDAFWVDDQFDFSDEDEPTKPGVPETPPCPPRNEPVENRAGYVAPQAVAA